MNKYINDFNTISLLTLNRQFKDFLTLQYTALHHLPPEQQFFIKQRNMAELKKHRDCRDSVIGIYGADSTLVAQGILARPGVSPHAQGYPIAPEAKEMTGLIQSISVHPDAQGRGFVGRILDGLAAQAVMNGQTMLMAKIAAANTASLRSFERSGFIPAQQAACPKNGQAYIYVHKPVFG